jgi:hypothetical protein
MTPEVRAFEYAIGLFSVIIGLAVADIATSFHRLVRRGPRVDWDPLTLLAALYALWIVIGLWFQIWRIRDVPESRHFLFFVSIFAELFVLFLVAAASLPDELEADVDLRAYYQSNRRYFWLLIVLYQLGFAAHGAYFYTHGLHAPWMHLASNFAIPLVVPIVLLVTKSRVVHYAGIAILFAVTGIDRASFAIN